MPTPLGLINSVYLVQLKKQKHERCDKRVDKRGIPKSMWLAYLGLTGGMLGGLL